MLSINVADVDMPQYLKRAGQGATDQVSVACINSPLNCTLSGAEERIDAIKTQADRDGIFAHKLKTGVAYHSAAMQAIAGEYAMSIGTLEGAGRRTNKVMARIPMVSSVSGRAVRQEDLSKAQYWVNNLVSPVRFSDAIQLLTQQSSTLKVGMGNISDLIEIGPHAALRRPVNDTVQQAHNRKRDIRYLHVLHRSFPAIQATLELAGQLFCLGHTVSLSAVNQQPADIRRPFLVDGPSYPFDRSNNYWTESRISRDFRLRGAVHGDTLGVRVSDWNPLEPRWRNFLSTESTRWLGDHKVGFFSPFPSINVLTPLR
jgi:acyl transferase domain-containing protein